MLRQTCFYRKDIESLKKAEKERKNVTKFYNLTKASKS